MQDGMHIEWLAGLLNQASIDNNNRAQLHST